MPIYWPSSRQIYPCSEAAALPLVFVTAWEGLVDRAQVQATQKVLIHAGAGGVGHVAVQIAHALGAQVFATVSADKRKIAEGYGAVAIDYRTTTVDTYVAQHTGGEGFDVVYDTVGGTTLDDSFFADKRRHRQRLQLSRLGRSQARAAFLSRRELLPASSPFAADADR